MNQLAYLARCAGRPPPRDRVRSHPIAWGGCTPKMGGLPRRKAASAIILMMALVASGCAAQRTIVENSSARAVPTDHVFVSLGPGGPAIFSVIQSDYANATRQTIALATRGKTPGENQLRVDVFGVKNDNIALDTSLPDLPLKEAELTAEAQDALPDVPLRVSNNYLQNRYGPFGYIVGKTTQGDTCVYAWQRLATPDVKISLINSRNAISIRLRLCDSAASEAALAATMMNLSVNVALSSGSWTPEPRELSADVGAVNAPTAPPQIATAAANPLPPLLTRAAPPLRVRHARRAPSPERATPAASVVQPPALTGVVVPPPPLAALNAPAPARTDSAPSPAQISVPPPPQEPRQ
jgi:Cellulose biosynthesis protein BcsN